MRSTLSDAKSKIMADTPKATKRPTVLVASNELTAAANTCFLDGGGEMGAHIRGFDWAKTPVGPIESWTPGLRMMIGVLLANRFPLLLWWGPHYISFYYSNT